MKNTECGTVVYKASTQHSKLPSKEGDFFSNGNAVAIGNRLIFENANLYLSGTLTVTVDVVSSFYPTEVAYSFEFEIRIIDCNVEENYFEFTKDPIIVCRRN